MATVTRRTKQSSPDKPSGDTGNTGATMSVLGTLKKAIKAGSDWSDKDEFLDVIYWLRQLIGVLIGVVWGIIPIKGFVGILLFVAVNVAIVYLYLSMFQRVDEEEFGGVSEILKEGLMTSLATFFVTWIILFSALHTGIE